MPAIVVTAAKFVGKAVVKEAAKRSPGGIYGLIGMLVGGSMLAGLVMVNVFVGAVAGVLASGSGNDCGGSGTAASSVPGIPKVALDAYQKAGQASGVDWTYIAAIGKVESQHGAFNGSVLSDSGLVVPPILGVVLDGSTPGTGVTRYNGPGNVRGFDRAQGPMQFILGTWASKGQDGNLDGKKDPQNIYDAALATALYLRDLGAPGDMDKAIFGYNHSMIYVDEIKRIAADYRLKASATTGAVQGSVPTLDGGVNTGAALDGQAQYGGHSTSDLGPVKPSAIVLANTLAPMFKIKDVGGFRAGDQDHGDGLAIDFMTYDDSATGQAMADYAKLHYKELGIHYIIWQQKIWNIDRDKEGWRQMEDRGSPTANHMDHVHISLTGNPGSGVTPSGGCGYMPTGNAGAKKDGNNGENAWGGHSNGRIPDQELCFISFSVGNRLRCDARDAFEQLNLAYHSRFGTSIAVTDSYRSYEGQVAAFAKYGSPRAARPGTSNHGWGLALDLGGGINSFGTAQYNWMKANAARYGWAHPSWAEPGGSAPEPWHWVYTG